MANNKRIPHKYLPWIDARKKFKLSHAHIQMARELGLSPKRFGKLQPSPREPWKSPLPVFIETLYLKKFGKERPDEVRSIEDMAAAHMAAREARKAAKQLEEAGAGDESADGSQGDETPS